MNKGKKHFLAFFLCVVVVLLLIPPQNLYAASKTKISKCSIALSKTSISYTGKACKPNVTVKNGKKSLKNGKDFTIKYSNNVNPGTATVTVTGKGNYSGSAKKTFKIKNGLTVSLAKTAFIYSGSAYKPAVSVKSGKSKLSSKNYSLTYKNNIDVGTAAIVIKGKGKYKGKNAYLTFVINAKSLTKTTVSLAKTSYTYSGNANKPSVSVTDGKMTLKEGKDYNVAYKNNVEVDTATVIITGKGNYTGTLKKTFQIAKASAQYSLSEKSKTINVGDNTAYIRINGYKNGVNVNVSSSNPDLISATHNGEGKIELYAREKGTATITVTIEKIVLNCEVTAIHPNQNPDGPIGPGSHEEQGQMGDTTQYVGEARGISWNDTFNERMGLGEVDHTKIVYSSEDESVATVEPMPTLQTNENGVTEFEVGDSYLRFVGPGETTVHAKYTTNGKEYEQTLFVTCLALDDAYMSVSVNQNASYDTSTDSDAVTGYAFGRKANSVLGQVSLEGADAKAYNNPSGFTTYEKDGVLYVFVTDAWNNRVMVYTSSGDAPTILDAMMGENDSLKDPVLVLGQEDAVSSTTGSGMNQLCWPMDCEVDSQGRLYVADTHNGRIQVWDDITSKVTSGVNGINADHTIGWMTTDHSKATNHLNWVWAIEIAMVDTNGDGTGDSERMVVTSTGNSTVCVWDALPENWEEGNAHYYPNLVMECDGTPRTITWTGKQLLVGDENIGGYSNSDGRDCGVRVINGWPTKAYYDGKGLTATEYSIGGDTQYWYKTKNYLQFEDFCSLNDYGEGVMINGKLYFASSMKFSIYNEGKIISGKEPDKVLEKQLNNSGLNGDTSGWFGYQPSLTGGLQSMIYEESTHTLYVMSHFGEGVLCWENMQTLVDNAGQCEGVRDANNFACPFPTHRLRALSYDYDTKENSAKVQTLHSPIVETDGKHLVVLDDLDQKLRVYKNIPTSSGALPDYCYNLQYESGDVVLYTDKATNKTTMMLTARTQNLIYIWNDYKFDGALPDTILSKGIGGIYFVHESVKQIEYDGTYTYINVALKPSEYSILVYKGIPNKDSKPIAYINGTSEGTDLTMDMYHGQVTSNGTTVTIIPDRYNVMILQTSQFATATEGNPVTLTRDNAQIVNKVNYGDEITWDPNKELTQETNDPDGVYAGGCKDNHFNIYKDVNDKVYHIRNTFNYAISSLITDDGKFVVCDGGENVVIIWESVADAVSGATPKTIIGRSSRESDFESLYGVYNYHERQFITVDDALAMPYYMAYDGTNLWVGEFKFSNRLLRFNLTE